MGRGRRLYVERPEPAVAGQPARLRKQIRSEIAADEEFRQRFLGLRAKLIDFRHFAAEVIEQVNIDEESELSLVCVACPGETLAEILGREGRLVFPIWRALASMLLKTIHAAHLSRLVHGNLAPDHIWLEREPKRDVLRSIKVADFGLGMPISRGLWGAQGYLAPEQTDAASPVPEASPRSDQYACATILCAALCGDAEATRAALLQHLQEGIRLQSPQIDEPVLRERAERMADRLLQARSAQPTQRLASVAALREALLEGSGTDSCLLLKDTGPLRAISPSQVAAAPVPSQVAVQGPAPLDALGRGSVPASPNPSPSAAAAGRRHSNPIRPLPGSEAALPAAAAVGPPPWPPALPPAPSVRPRVSAPSPAPSVPPRVPTPPPAPSVPPRVPAPPPAPSGSSHVPAPPPTPSVPPRLPAPSSASSAPPIAAPPPLSQVSPVLVSASGSTVLSLPRFLQGRWLRLCLACAALGLLLLGGYGLLQPAERTIPDPGDGGQPLLPLDMSPPTGDLSQLSPGSARDGSCVGKTSENNKSGVGQPPAAADPPPKPEKLHEVREKPGFEHRGEHQARDAGEPRFGRGPKPGGTGPRVKRTALPPGDPRSPQIPDGKRLPPKPSAKPLGSFEPSGECRSEPCQSLRECASPLSARSTDSLAVYFRYDGRLRHLVMIFVDSTIDDKTPALERFKACARGKLAKFTLAVLPADRYQYKYTKIVMFKQKIENTPGAAQ